MGVCDIPVISSVCDVAGEAAATLISAPFDWLASAMGVTLAAVTLAFAALVFVVNGLTGGRRGKKA